MFSFSSSIETTNQSHCMVERCILNSATKFSIIYYAIVFLNVEGVCEPIGSHLCSEKNSWLMDCSPEKLNCPAINASGKTIAEIQDELMLILLLINTHLQGKQNFPDNQGTHYVTERIQAIDPYFNQNWPKLLTIANMLVP